MEHQAKTASTTANPTVVRVLSAFARAASIVAVIVPVLVLIGWVTDQPGLKRIVPTLVAMNPMTAVSFMCCGVALRIVLADATPAWRGAAMMLGLVAVIVGTMKLVSFFLLNADPWAVDRLLFPAKLDAEVIRNRMAPNTALGLVLTGTALSLLAGLPRVKRAATVAQVLAIGVASVGLLALVGYAYRSYSLYGIGSFTPMALHTATIFLFLSLGILSARPDVGVMCVITSDQPAGALARRMLPLAILVPALIGGVRLWGITRNLWSPEFGFTLVVLADTVIFTSLLWWELALLRRADVRRATAEQKLRYAYGLVAEAAESERVAHEKLKRTHSQLVQAEKMAGLGQMVAGVAHEINNPLAFVSNNVAVLQRDTRGLCELLALHAQLAQAKPEERDALAAEIADLGERIDVGYVTTNLPEMLTRSREGLKRIQQIVRDLRDFARLDEAEVQEADVNAGIRSTANIVEGHAHKRQVKVDLRLGSLPPLRCHSAKLNQVVMNLLTNAIDASPEGGTVTVHTSPEPDAVRIEVVDEGGGVPAGIRQRIFDPFFTTKPPGRGTGLGLSISYGIVRDHGGDISVADKQPGEGARFIVRIPMVRERKDALQTQQTSASSPGS